MAFFGLCLLALVSLLQMSQKLLKSRTMGGEQERERERESERERERERVGDSSSEVLGGLHRGLSRDCPAAVCSRLQLKSAPLIKLQVATLGERSPTSQLQLAKWGPL